MAVESVSIEPTYSSNQENTSPDLQKMRILVGPPLKKPPKYPITEESLLPVYVPPLSDSIPSDLRSLFENIRGSSDGLKSFVILCTSDFVMVRKEVFARTRRVRLIGLEAAGNTSLFRALLGQVEQNNCAAADSCLNPDVREGVAGGLCYVDSPGLNIQVGQKPPKHDNSMTAAAVGASVGAGLGVGLAIVMGAASALRKP